MLTHENLFSLEQYARLRPEFRARVIAHKKIRVVPVGAEHSEAIALAKTIASKSAYVLKIGKTAFYRQAEMSLEDAYRYTAEVMTENMMARDASEGIGAFIEKRSPRWQDS